MNKKPKSKWQTKELADTFLEGVRGAIPGADLQLLVISKIVQKWQPQARSILDLGCGDGILGRFLMKLFPEAQVVLTDFSEPMLDAARGKLDGNPNTIVVNSDFSQSSWKDTVAYHAPFDIIISGYAVHHQSDKRKTNLYNEIFDLLSANGLFLNLEHVASVSKAGESLFDDFFIDHLYEFNRLSEPQKTREDVSNTYYNRPDKKENILASVDLQCEWLRQIGFRDVDCFFKVFELALFGGRKKIQSGG